MKIVIDGNIGAGKTTQLTLLEKLGARVFKEPIDQWPLEEFYLDPKKGIFPLQMTILRTVGDKGPGIYERSLLSSRWVFWEHAKRKNLVEHGDTYEYFYEKHSWLPDLYIFLSKSPEECYLHLSGRMQIGDNKITLDYLKELDVLYKEMIMKVPCRVFVLDASARPEEIHAKILHIISNNEHSEVLFGDCTGKKVQELGKSGGKVRSAPCPIMCRMS
jgi:deoxyadenosine/deoxycytidine kinase